MPLLDRFSAQAVAYARYRIDYPADLYAWLWPQVPVRRRAWDCATGNGQVAAVLADYFEQVDATDLSESQLAQATPHPCIHYQRGYAEQAPFPDQQFDLITVAQAVHWFDPGAYHREVRRVARPGAVLAEWGYHLAQTDDADLNEVIRHFHTATLGPYWDANRWHVLDEYARIPFPFAAVQTARFAVHRHWSAARMLDYLRTWSGVQHYCQRHARDPVVLIADDVRRRWGPGTREVTFPVFARSGRIE